ncbi:MAG: nucleotidyltransferase domain-containing protein [Deltaproteobacteria bacterium]|nr:nucleotidyltransferase domain-containing protein [Deltaproteobacteria bacterium]
MTIVAQRLIGSHARGEADGLSDLDVLLISDAPLTQGARKKITTEYEHRFGTRVEVSVYGINRYQKMSREGHLFTWHVWLESLRLTEKEDFIDRLGKPGPWRDAAHEARELAIDLQTVLERLKSKVRTEIYDAGIGFICIRNIAIHLSCKAPGGLIFSRLAPFDLDYWLPHSFPLSRSTYRGLFAARACRMRPKLTELTPEPEVTLEAIERAADWAIRSIKWVFLAEMESPRIITGRRSRFRQRVHFEREVLEVVNSRKLSELSGLSFPAISHWHATQSDISRKIDLTEVVRFLTVASKTAHTMADRSSDVFAAPRLKPFDLNNFSQSIGSLIPKS